MAQICHRLDGIPLALELAAARVKALPVEKLAERLDDSFRLLIGGSRTALPRQQTLRAMIDWSYNLLSRSEQAVLRRLSVFAGGWTLEAAEAVCAGDPVEEWEVLDLLSSLVGKSLVVYEEQDGEERYSLLETIRQYGRHRLEESQERETLARGHRDYYERFASGASRPWRAESAPLLEREHDNLRAAERWNDETDTDPKTRFYLSVWVNQFRMRHGYIREAREQLAQVLSRGAGSEHDLVRIQLHYLAGGLASIQGDRPAHLRLMEIALGMARSHPDQHRLLTVCLNGWGDAYRWKATW